MSNDPQIVLLDLDGTIIYPGGYRAAYAATLQDLLALMNLDSMRPRHEIQEHFEAISVNSEWDMLPITVAIILETVYEAYPGLPVPDTLSQAIEEVRQLDANHLRVDYREALTKLMPCFHVGETPSVGLLKAANGTRRTPLFPRLGQTALLEDLLLNTRDIGRSLVLRMFQTYVLGGQQFFRAYGLLPPFESDSLLVKHDAALVTRDTVRTLLRMNESGEVHLSILTCRPSGPPRELGGAPDARPTDSDVAVALLGIEDLPLIGYGRLQYLASEHRIQPDGLMKPSPVQALAAIGAAWTGQERASLEWAFQMHGAFALDASSSETRAFPPSLEPPLPRHIELHVFEDTPTGIVSARGAAQVLERGGWGVQLHAWGIAHSEVKRHPLESCGARVYPAFEDAFQDFLADRGGV